MSPILLRELCEREWISTTQDGAVQFRVTAGPPASRDAAARFRQFHHSVREFFTVTTLLTFGRADGEPTAEDIRIEAPLLDPNGMPMRGDAEVLGSRWLMLSPHGDGGGFLLEIKLGTVVYYAPTAGYFALAAASLSDWLDGWRDLSSPVELVPDPPVGVADRLGNLRGRLPGAVSQALEAEPDDTEVLWFRDAPGQAWPLDERPLTRVPGQLAWTRAPRRVSFLRRLFGGA